MKTISVWKSFTKTKINIIREDITRTYFPTYSSCERLENIIDKNKDTTSISISPTFVNIMTFLYKGDKL